VNGHLRFLVNRLALIPVVASLLIATVGCGGARVTTHGAVLGTTTTRVVAPPKPTRYQQLLRGVTPARALRSLCPGLEQTIGTNEANAAQWLSGSAAATTDSYAAADYLASGAAFTVGRDYAANLTTAIFGSALHRLKAVAKPGITYSMLRQFAKDALSACGLSTRYASTRASLIDLKARGNEINDLAASKPWYPAGYYESPTNPDLAWQWTNAACGSDLEGSYCWQISIVTNAECSDTYGELSISQGNTVLDYTNDTLGALSPGQTGVLNFEWYGDNGVSGTLTGHVTKLDCY
jgi:hypothetical protein